MNSRLRNETEMEINEHKLCNICIKIRTSHIDQRVSLFYFIFVAHTLRPVHIWSSRKRRTKNVDIVIFSNSFIVHPIRNDAIKRRHKSDTNTCAQQNLWFRCRRANVSFSFGFSVDWKICAHFFLLPIMIAKFIGLKRRKRQQKAL